MIRVLTQYLLFGYHLSRIKSIGKVLAKICRGPDGRTLKRRLFGYTMLLNGSRSDAHRWLFLKGERFIEERFLLSRMLQRGMTVLDVGANIGYYALLFEKYVGPDGEVILVEPHPENLNELKENLQANGFENVELNEVAVGAVEGETEMRDGINSGVVNIGEGAFKIKIKTLDSLTDQKIDFLKIDVEGFEGQVLEGGRRIIADDRPIIFIEIHPAYVVKYGYSVFGVLSMLNEFYDNVELYSCREDSEESKIKSYLNRFRTLDVVQRINNNPDFLNLCEKGEITKPFWAVCRPSPNAWN